MVPIYMMVEIPGNVLLPEEIAEVFDGFSIGSNDLTQLTPGLDRDSQLISALFDENNPAPKQMITLAIEKANKTKEKNRSLWPRPQLFTRICILPGKVWH